MNCDLKSDAFESISVSDRTPMQRYRSIQESRATFFSGPRSSTASNIMRAPHCSSIVAPWWRFDVAKGGWLISVVDCPVSAWSIRPSSDAITPTIEPLVGRDLMHTPPKNAWSRSFFVCVALSVLWPTWFKCYSGQSGLSVYCLQSDRLKRWNYIAFSTLKSLPNSE